jgi:hypothetical protein
MDAVGRNRPQVGFNPEVWLSFFGPAGMRVQWSTGMQFRKSWALSRKQRRRRRLLRFSLPRCRNGRRFYEPPGSNRCDTVFVRRNRRGLVSATSRRQSHSITCVDACKQSGAVRKSAVPRKLSNF